ncbi:NUDIX hydrolase [Roseobacter sp. CCS2]|uniref:NUDIX hydrolase n=1 Tax=Roseobacter sp. CCS2 TaxID=391593 RepID=UPI0000F40380|nr:NUDIX hydrolase [Roseobacter sp. CCS2]EBA13776.1 7,8-dihydro-8-oxoguanine-triphosphatase [Roseobacter sp. CCS2]
MQMSGPHDGAKVALFLGDRIVSILRDNLDHIPYPNLWDLPGGARDPGESPFDTVARETREEVGLVLPRSAIVWESAFPANDNAGKWVAFFVARLPATSVADIVFGNEGQRWALYDLDRFIDLPNRVPPYGARLRRWMAETGGFAT